MRAILTRFSRANDEMFDEYRRVRYKVFVEEEKWPLDVDADGQRCAEDPADPCSSFILARSDESDPAAIGIIRSTVTSLAFPHEKLFANHLSSTPFSRVGADRIATVNSLAVIPAFRRRPVRVAGYDEPLTTARALLLDSVDWLRSQRVLLVVASAVPIASARLFGGVGFAALDPFQQFGPGRIVLNMGLAIKQSPDRIQPQEAALGDEVSAYLAWRHAVTTGGRALAEYIDGSVTSQ